MITTRHAEIPPLIETEVTRQITATLTATARRKLFSVIFGDTGRSKTLTCQHYTEANPSTVLVELPGAVNHAEFVQVVTQAIFGGQDFGSTRKNKAEITAFLRKNERMIIVDEFNQLLMSQNNRAIVKSFEFLRRNIFDLTATPVVLVFTSYSLKDLRHGSLSGFLEQFRGRIGYPLQIPARMLKTREIRPIVDAYVPDADQALIDAAMDVATPGEGKIRTLVKYLGLAREYVEKHGGSIDAALLIKLRDRYDDGGYWPED